MPREAELSTNEREFILNALRQNMRLDGRSSEEYRGVELAFGNEYGLVDVKMGKTRVAVRVSCEVIAPYPDRKFEGMFIITSEFSPMASPAFEVGRQNQTEIILSRILEKAIRRSSALDTESLCIIAGQKCFSLRADVHVLDHDGNLIDASCIALVAALQHFRRPDVQVEGEKVTIFTSREREPVPLSMLHHPLCVTFSYFDGGNIRIMDATAAEEQVREGEVIITMNRNGEICQIAKYGGVPVDALALVNWTGTALTKVKEMTKFIQLKLEEDAKRRDLGGLIAELRSENERPRG
ncbi:exosome complex component rrp45 [Venturia nashicola]|uniref:Exosome complex component RRP45 n=1 Tax=Venturia nashicola TaxID=86259 RepID=A0A4Z1NVG8_9PEZI|nr:exosome complex component rrp45 [Venturia nashicola]TLD21021.1 exosome complex component rrp45 [Venturia nashicola]